MPITQTADQLGTAQRVACKQQRLTQPQLAWPQA